MESYFSKSPDYDCKVVTEKLFYILQSSILFHRFTTRFKSIIFQCSHLCDKKHIVLTLDPNYQLLLDVFFDTGYFHCFAKYFF